MKSVAKNNMVRKLSDSQQRSLEMPIIVYGIPTCDTTKKTIDWLKKNNSIFSFHDYKLHGISKNKLAEWFGKENWQNIFNKRSTSWRDLSAAEKNKVVDEQSAIEVMRKNNSIIKRPIIEYGNQLLVGFNEKDYTKHLKK